jgi:flagellar motor protein MotB
MSGSIGRQTTSYRHGVVLGLTMAEIMLLLVFSLLIAIGVALASERTRRAEVIERLHEAEAEAAASGAVVDEIKRNPHLSEFLARTAAHETSPAKVDEFWRTLVENDEIVEAMERRGVSRRSLREGGDYFLRMQQLKSLGLDPDTAVRGAALATAIDRAVPKEVVADKTPEQIAALIAKGVATSAEPHDVGGAKEGHTWPPIINLSEAGGYYFATRSAELRPEFEAQLRTTVVEKLIEIASTFQVDVIEVIGHTDERAFTGGLSNLDRELPAATSGAKSVGVLQPADNAGLGLARALAVVEVLSSELRLRNFRILPLSGAQLIGTDGRLTHWEDQGDVRERRRIEIRMRKSTCARRREPPQPGRAVQFNRAGRSSSSSPSGVSAIGLA